MPTSGSAARSRCRNPGWLALIILAAGCASVADRGADRPTSSALTDVRETRLGRQFLDLSEAHAGKSGYRLIDTGVDGLATRVQIIRHAERTLDLQYFIFRGDETGTLIREELRRAADRGVRVRVLVDDGDTRSGDEKVLELDGYPNMQVLIFNAFDTRSHNVLVRNLDFAFHKGRLDYRMHNKLLVADNAVALIGGRNVGNQYFQVDPDSQFADDEVFVAGPMTQALSREFDEFWNGDMVVPARALGGLAPYTKPASIPVVRGGGIDYLALIDSDEPYRSLISRQELLTWTSARLVYDSPDKKYIEQRGQRGRLMSQAVEQEIAGAQQEVLIVSPYFVPSDAELSLLEALHARGATAKVLTNSLEAAPSLAAQSGYDKVRGRLLRAGVKLFEVRAMLDDGRGSGQTRRVSQNGNYALHAKLYAFDRQRCFIGSWNYDRRSLNINTEMGLLIDDPTLATHLARRIDAMTLPGAAYQVLFDTESSGGPKLVWETEVDHQRVRLFKEPTRGWLKRERAKLLELLPLQPEL
jgi:putative cardiolipin synthase